MYDNCSCALFCIGMIVFHRLFGHGEQSFFYEIDYRRVYSHGTSDSSGCLFSINFDFFKKDMRVSFISRFLIN